MKHSLLRGITIYAKDRGRARRVRETKPILPITPSSGRGNEEGKRKGDREEEEKWGMERDVSEEKF